MSDLWIPKSCIPDEKAKRYISDCGKKYIPPDSISYTNMPVLEFLWGEKWDHFALNFVHGLRPSMIRVTQGAVTCDSVGWRVTVYVDGSIITKIEQEVEVGVEGKYDHAWDLMIELDKRMKAKKIRKQKEKSKK